MVRSVTSLSVVVLLLVIACSPAAAEPFVDLYAGAASTRDSALRFDAFGAGVREEVSWDRSLTVGGRLGYYFGWLGIALDASFFEPEDDIVVVPISALAMLRIPLLKSSEFPGGRLQPYVAAGPSLFITWVDGSLPTGGRATGASPDIGADVRGGLTVLLTPNLGIFAEYRYTHVKPDIDLDFVGLDVEAETEFRTHHINGGVSLRF